MEFFPKIRNLSLKLSSGKTLLSAPKNFGKQKKRNKIAKHFHKIVQIL